eukprot:gene15220-18003_t
MSTEDDVLKLWVNDETRVIDELEFWEDNFIARRYESLICRAKTGKTLLSKAAWEEMVRLQEWLNDVQYTDDDGTYAFNNFCYKPVDRLPQYSCFSYSPLDCFQEGRVQVIGGENNTVCWTPYEGRQSFRSDDFDFATHLTKEYLLNSCMFWFNLEIPYEQLFGDVTYSGDKDSDPITDIGAVRITLSALSPESLSKEGLHYVTWSPTVEAAASLDKLGCPEGGPYDSPDGYCSCSKSYSIFVALSYDCVPAAVPQESTCCDYLTEMFSLPCFPYLLLEDATVSSISRIVGGECGLVPPDIPDTRCYTKADSSTTTEGTMSSLVFHNLVYIR